MSMIKLGMWVKKQGRKGVYLVADMDIEKGFATLKDVFIGNKGEITYGNKKYMVTLAELDRYELA